MTMLEFARKLLVEEALLVVPALWIIGKIIKGTPRFQDWTIPYILLVIGTALTIGILGFNVDAIIQGILVSGLSVYGHNLLVQTKEGIDK